MCVGLRLIEAPIDLASPLSDDYPFQSVVSVELSVPPPADSHIPAQWFEV